MARKALIEKNKEGAQVLHTEEQPLSAVRASTCIHAEVRHLPNLLPWDGAPGRDPGRS